VFQSNTQMIRLNNKKLDTLGYKVVKIESSIQEMRDILVTYADKLPSFDELPVEAAT